MKKTYVIILSIFLSSCYSVREIISDTYKFDNDLEFKIINYSEPPNSGNFIRSNNDKYVEIKILMTNKGKEIKTPDFKDFYIISKQNNVKIPLWRIGAGIQPLGRENTTTKIEPFGTKKIWLKFVANKTHEIKFLYFNNKIIELNFGKTKQSL